MVLMSLPAIPWSDSKTLVDKYPVSPLLRDYFGWFYLVSGLVLTVASIVLPAHQDLAVLKEKRAAILEDTADLQHQIIVHQEFLNDLNRQDSTLQERMVQMQFNQPPSGTPVVIDRAASKTPLDWVAQRARRDRAIYLEEPRQSLLSRMTSGKNRLWLAGAGVFVIFIGLITSSPLEDCTPSTH